MSDRTIELMTAINTRLNALTGLTDIVGSKIYSHIPQDTDLPYCRFGVNAISANTWSHTDNTYTLTVQVFANDNLSALTARKAIQEGLQRQESNISLSAGTLNLIESLQMDIFQETDAETWQGIIAFRILVTS